VLAGVARAESPDAVARHLVLVGVVLGRGDGPIAVVEDRRTGKEALYRVGDRIQDVTLLAVAADRVILRAGGQDVELRLAASARSNPVPAVVTPPPRTVPARSRARPRFNPWPPRVHR
jgi:type II secretory pathway component PulC